MNTAEFYSNFCVKRLWKASNVLESKYYVSRYILFRIERERMYISRFTLSTKVWTCIAGITELPEANCNRFKKILILVQKKVLTIKKHFDVVVIKTSKYTTGIHLFLLLKWDFLSLHSEIYSEQKLWHCIFA